MKPTTKILLYEAWDYCDTEDKSTEFMLQYMADFAEVDYHVAVNFVTNDNGKRDLYHKGLLHWQRIENDK